MEWIETNGVVLRYELSGAGRVPLLLIHELGGSLEFWDALLPAFQPAFRVLRYDLRGFGMSEKVKTLRLDDLLGTVPRDGAALSPGLLVQRQHEFDGFLHQWPLPPLPPGEGRGEGPQVPEKAPHPVIKPSPRGRGDR